eukprot:TRINITY_DN533_c1_g1_i2.p1 TRINITY_DN533_c1_g1~~TRINITY_DN533_c1_g1_i2.p1  ORF type:complete len:1130 (-),score=412.15 TRINITY_DN533_c1_g1_i2:54-3443(-)
MPVSPESLRVCVVGAEQCGKTALVIRILFEEFEENSGTTVEDEYHHTFVVGVREYNIDVLDTGGMEVYQSQYTRWFSWADSFIYVFNLCEEESLLKLKVFREEILKAQKRKGVLMRSIPMILVGTQLDGAREVTYDTGLKMASALGCPYFETSARDDIEVSGLSPGATDPGSILTMLVEEKIRKASWQKLEELNNIPHQDLSKSKKGKSPPKKEPEPEPMIPILDELRLKWGKPIEKLPVYIDLPRLATKITVTILPVSTSPVITISPPNPREIIRPSSPIGKSDRNLGPVKSTPNLPGTPVKDKDKKKDKKDKKEKEKLSKEKEADRKKREALLKHKKMLPGKSLSESDIGSLNSQASEFVAGTRVRFPDHPQWGIGTVKFNGIVSFDSGIWLGIMLDTPVGKHNGTVKNVSYFLCPEKCGIFARPEQVDHLFQKIPPSKFSGGCLRSAGEEWIYESTGMVTLQNVTIDSKPVKYEWDGSTFKPSGESISFGAGQWTGENIVWYKKEWMIFRTSKREEFVKFSSAESDPRYKPEYKIASLEGELPSWIWKGDNLISEPDMGKWEVDTPGQRVPIPIAIFLQCIRYVRYGIVKNDHVTSTSTSTSSSTSTEVKKRSESAALSESLGLAHSSPASIPTSPAVKKAIEKETHSPLSTSPALSQFQLEKKQEPQIKLNVKCFDFKLRIPIGESATVEQLGLEIERRVSKKFLEDFKDVNNTDAGVQDILKQLKSAVRTGDKDHADQSASLTRKAVAIIENRIQYGESLLGNLPRIKNIDQNELIREALEGLDGQKMLMVKAVIGTLKSPSAQNFSALDSVMGKVGEFSDKLKPMLPRVEFIRLQTGNSASELVDLDPMDTVADVLDSERFVHPVFGLPRTAEEIQKNEEDEKKKQAAEQLEEIEHKKKWEALLSSLGDGTGSKRQSLIRSESQFAPYSKTNAENTSSSEKRRSNRDGIGELIKQIMCQISDVFEEKEQSALIRSEFSKFVSGAGDTSRQLSKFLEHVLKDNSKMSKVLKAINQSIIATPFIRLKVIFPTHLPFEDKAGSWTIEIVIEPQRCVKVIHRKAGSSKEGPPQGGFEFQWELTMTFPWNLETMQSAVLKITNLTFDKGIVDTHKKEVQHIVDTFSCP